MEAILNEDWTADVVGRMHRCKIKNEQLAHECGYSATYLSTVLNGNKDNTIYGNKTIEEIVYKAKMSKELESFIIRTIEEEGY